MTASHIQLRLDVALNRAQQMPLGSLAIRNRDALKPSTRRAPNTMHIIFRRHRQIVIHHMRHARNVNPAPGQIGGHQHARHTGAETLQRRLPCTLAHIAMHRLGIHAVMAKMFGNLIGAALGTRKHDRPRHRMIGQQITQQETLVASRSKEHALLDLRRRTHFRRHTHHHRIMQEAARQSINLRHHRRREHRRLPALGNPRQNLPHIDDEPHLEHAVHFIEHQVRRAIQLELASRNQIQQTPRRANDDIRPGTHPPHLARTRHAAEHDGGAQTQTSAQHLRMFLDLHSQLTRRREDQGAGMKPLHPIAILRQSMQQRQQESGRLASPRLGNAHQVPAFQQRGDRTKLDRRRRGITLRRHSRDNRAGQPKAIKILSIGHVKHLSACPPLPVRSRNPGASCSAHRARSAGGMDCEGLLENRTGKTKRGGPSLEEPGPRQSRPSRSFARNLSAVCHCALRKAKKFHRIPARRHACPLSQLARPWPEPGEPP